MRSKADRNDPDHGWTPFAFLVILEDGLPPVSPVFQACPAVAPCESGW
jgi:hypothetical protein